MIPRNQIFVGDCMDGMRKWPNGFVQSVVTSPPYFWQRQYLPDGHPDHAREIGREPTAEGFIATMVTVFREVRRIMRDDGVLFLNLGDSYADDTKWGGKTGGKHVSGLHGTTAVRSRRGTDNDPKRGAANGQPKRRTESGMLNNIPHRVAEALRQDGWNWRMTIIWGKKSPMPESQRGPRWERCGTKEKTPREFKGHDRLQQSRDATGKQFASPTFIPCSGCEKCAPNGGLIYRKGKGRCTTAHEYVFVFSKTPNYFWDSVASAEPVSGNAHSRGSGVNPKVASIDPGNHKDRPKQNASFSAAVNELVDRRNPRSVWLLSTEGEKKKHYATFPSELVRRCLVAGCSAGGCCAHCGKPWAPIVERDRIPTRPGDNHKATLYGKSEANTDAKRHISISRCLGYRAACNCPAHEPARQIVFDPFSGMCTVQQTARQLGHDWLGTELSPIYAADGIPRIDEKPRWLIRQEKAAKVKRQKPAAELPSQLSLFTEESA